MRLSRYLSPFAGLLVTVLLSTSAFANSVPINLFNIYSLSDSGGTITFNPSTQTLTMISTLTGIKSGSMDYVGDFGTVTFTTGPLTSGSIYGYAQFNGGTFTITTNGLDGLPDGVLLSGTFGVVNWHEIGDTGEFWFSARFGGGNMHQTSMLITGTTQFNVIQGATVIPEPGTWALLGTGICFVIGTSWRTGIGWRGSRFNAAG